MVKISHMRWFVFILLYIVIDIYAFQAFKTLVRWPWVHYLYLVTSLLVLANLVYHISNMNPSKGFDQSTMFAMGFFLVLFVPKILTVCLMLFEDIFRLLMGLYDRFVAHENRFVLPSRRKFISGLALGLAAVPFLSLLYGMYRGKYRFRVLDYDLYFEDLPEAFDGYKITQISDVHSGSFDDHEKITYAVDLINKQQGDVILFTGDLVNNTSSEMDAWKSLFTTLSAKDGVFSVLGNHDYGDYVTWESEKAKEKNLEDLKRIQREMGWDLLLNEHRLLERNGQKIALVGVENWGAGGFKKAGDAEAASVGLKNTDFKILMSHDPSYWAEKIKTHPNNFQLTLSGHTHGMQFGIEIPGLIKWSPVQYRYKYWAGIYEHKKRMINVNRGFGFLGYPGRVGIWPEITTIHLRKGNKNTI